MPAEWTDPKPPTEIDRLRERSGYSPTTPVAGPRRRALFMLQVTLLYAFVLGLAFLLTLSGCSRAPTAPAACIPHAAAGTLTACPLAVSLGDVTP